VSNTHFNVAVFDFDGTLVQSTEIKHQVFYDIFPAECAPVIASILHIEPESSRYRVIPLIVAESRRQGIALPRGDIEGLISQYADGVVAAVTAAPQMPGADQVLRTFAGCMSVYISSTTPQQQLENFVVQRGWMSLISGVFGFPRDKRETVALLLKKHSIPPSRLLVIGDGESDRYAARQNSCPFFHISEAADLSCVFAFAAVTYA
jgi:phosphoglycolate phosphatase-like HAD superfamily hydrolase